MAGSGVILLMTGEDTERSDAIINIGENIE